MNMQAHQVRLNALTAVMVQIESPAVHKVLGQDACSHQRLLCQLLCTKHAHWLGGGDQPFMHFSLQQGLTHYGLH